MITGISGFAFLLSKNGRFVTHISFSKNALLKPLFLWYFLGARFFGQVVKKRDFLDTRQKRRKNRLITEKLFSRYLCFCCFSDFWATSLGPKTLLIFFCFVSFCLFLFLFVSFPF